MRCDNCSYKIACELLDPGFHRPPISDANGDIFKTEESCYRVVKYFSERYTPNKFHWKIKPQVEKMVVANEGDMIYNSKNMQMSVFMNGKWNFITA